MDFIQHTLNWVKGEIFEALIFGSFGLIVIILSVLFWKFGGTPNSKALIIPFAIVGVFYFIIALTGIFNNNKRKDYYVELYNKDKSTFVLSEKQRVEEFQYLYKMTIAIASICFVLAMAFFIFSKNNYLQSIALALILFGFTGLIIDYFSKERADIYYKLIIYEMNNLNLY